MLRGRGVALKQSWASLKHATTERLAAAHAARNPIAGFTVKRCCRRKTNPAQSFGACRFGLRPPVVCRFAKLGLARRLFENQFLLHGLFLQLPPNWAVNADLRAYALGPLPVSLGAMNPALKPYAVVRVLQLVAHEIDRDGWCVNLRSPQTGDIGTLVDVLHADGFPSRYVVECCNPDGTTVWLSEFVSKELELVLSPHA